MGKAAFNLPWAKGEEGPRFAVSERYRTVLLLPIAGGHPSCLLPAQPPVNPVPDKKHGCKSMSAALHAPSNDPIFPLPRLQEFFLTLRAIGEQLCTMLCELHRENEQNMENGT